MDREGNMRTKNALIGFVMLLNLIMMGTGCQQRAKTPPPDYVLTIMGGIKDGYNSEDVDLFTADFSDIMFTKGFTREAWRDTMKKVKQKLGAWQSEVYLGNEGDVYTWRGAFEKGKVKCVIVLNEDNKVTGLWFR
jgi:hypothetical protein